MRAAVFGLIALAGCVGLDPLPRSAEGYRAIRFREPMRMPAGLGSSWEPTVGTVLVADRARDGRPMYCGSVPVRDLITQIAYVCMAYDGTSLIAAADKPITHGPFPVPPGAIEELRLR